MEKKLVNNEKEYLDFVYEWLPSKPYQDVTSFTNVKEFFGSLAALPDGTVPKTVSLEQFHALIFQSKDSSNFPVSYPCVVVVEQSESAYGDTTWSMEFVYPSDFTQSEQ